MMLDVAGTRLRDILTSARSLYVSACAAEIADAPDLFKRHPPDEATVTGLFTPLVNKRSYAAPDIGLKLRTFFLTKGIKHHLATGIVEYCPWRYRMIDQYLSAPDRFDTALAMVSPPDAQGRCSFGVQADFLPSFHERVPRLIGFINPNMPWTAGHPTIPYSAFAATIDYPVPIKTALQPAPDADAEAIARRIATLVPDVATVQCGIGQIPSAAIAALIGHRGLKLHSGVVDDGVLALDAAGALDRDVPIVTGTAVGSTELYEALSDIKRFSLRPVSFTHAFRSVSEAPNFIAINSVLQVDLLGQVAAEGSAGRLVASPGGLPEFTRAALHSPGGKSIIAVRARAGGKGKGIVALLDRPHLATCPAADADIVVTEFGVAHIRELTLDQRAEALIAIADPVEQARLAAAWAGLRSELLGLPRASAAPIAKIASGRR
jgi:acyl-CoA hydrolase